MLLAQDPFQKCVSSLLLGVSASELTECWRVRLIETCSPWSVRLTDSGLLSRVTEAPLVQECWMARTMNFRMYCDQSRLYLQ